MKKLILLLFLSQSCSVSNSQSFHYEVGVSYSKLDWNYLYPWKEKQYADPLYGFSFSAGMGYLEKKKFSLSSDLSIYKSGGKYSKEEQNS